MDLVASKVFHIRSLRAHASAKFGFWKDLLKFPLPTQSHSKVIGSNDEEWFVDQSAIQVFEKFRNNLRHVEAIIQVRNEKREVPYDYMRPQTIVQSYGI